MPMEDANGCSPTATWASDTSKKLAKLALKARNVWPDKTHMVNLLLFPFAIHLFRLAAVFKEMQREAEILGTRLATSNVEKMDAEVKAAEQLVEDYSGRCQLYLLMCCPELMGQLKTCNANLRAALDSFSQDDGWSDSLKHQFCDAKESLDEGSLKLGAKEQILHDSLEQGVLDSIVADSSLTTKLARQIAECVGLSLESEGFANELAKLKKEKPAAEVRRGKAHSMYLEQFIVLLEKAVAATIKPANGEAQVIATPPSRSMTMRDTQILPLQSFICPITKDVMRDPVQIASGQTYERLAIERWFADGHTRCPTGVELKNTKMKSNFALRQSIAEWKERNHNIRMDVASDLIRSEEKEQQLKAVQDLQALCEEDSLNKYKVASKGLMPLLVHLAESSDLELRKKTFSALGLLAKDNVENQEVMVREKVIDVIVRCIARQYDEAPQCVHLMRLLSEKPDIAEKISRAPSAVLFLVTLMQDEECAENVKVTLENLPTSDENVVIMAEANIMKPLVTRLNEGGSASKILMAKTLGRLHTPDTSKVLVATTGESVHTLTRMMDSANEEEREAAIKALENLSSVSSVSRLVEEAGAIPILLKIIKGLKHSEAVRTGSAHIMSNILAAMGDEWVASSEREMALEETVCTFFQLMGSTTPSKIQYYLLQGLYGLAHGKDTGDIAKKKMKECDAFKNIVHLLKKGADAAAPDTVAKEKEKEDLLRVRRIALELLGCLSSCYRDDAGEALVVEDGGGIGILVEMVKDDKREAERLTATAILANLPVKDSRIDTLLLQADMVPILIRLLGHRNESLAEAAAGALLRFTASSPEMQLKLAGSGVIQLYISLLHSGRSPAKERAAKALTNFSSSTAEFSAPVPTPGCFQCFFSAKRPLVCRLHRGICSVDGTFCLLEAGAVGPLLDVLKENQSEDTACIAAALMALRTLVDSKLEFWEQGCSAIHEKKGLPTIINLMSSRSPQVQELAAILCERFFSLPEYRKLYAAQAQMHIVTLAQKGSPQVRHLAGQILRKLELLHSQSHYFGLSSS